MPVVTCVTATGDLVTLHLPPGLHHPDMAAVVDTLLQVDYILHAGSTLQCLQARDYCSRLGLPCRYDRLQFRLRNTDYVLVQVADNDIPSIVRRNPGKRYKQYIVDNRNFSVDCAAAAAARAGAQTPTPGSPQPGPPSRG